MAQERLFPMLSKHRLEALIDGIFAVAMTLLVIELQVPEHAAIHASSDLAVAVARLIPKFIAWTISFFVLGIFWFGQHRLFHFVHSVDGTLTWLTIAYLSLVSLMPFSSALAGEYAPVLFSQMFYSTNMLLLSAVSLLMHRYVFRHQELVSTPMPPPFYRAARFRLLGLMVVALVAIGITTLIPGAGNSAFMLMMPISIISGRLERK